MYSTANAQWIGSSLPKKIVASDRYLFYQHGGVVTVLGDMALNQSAPEWGPYEFNHILDSLRKRGFVVISEVRREGVDDSIYAVKIVHQIDTLLHNAVKPGNILVIGASAGWNITLMVSSRLKNESVHYVMMGGCWPETYKEYLSLDLYGHLLSVVESSDPHGTCERVMFSHKTLKSKREIVLTTGLSHGFIYKGYKEWIDPVMDWYLDPDK
ncbi:MAG TPA: hypothetical protein VFW11_03475 [Cyclobacteriaceae bacterium]|nr:hypothetical protein [Cyclobacteriaceae bacterium]